MNLLDLFSEEERKNAEILNVKICKECGVKKQLSSFPKRKDNHGGYDHRCRDCKKGRDKIVRKIKKNPPYEATCCESCGFVPNKQKSSSRGHRHMKLHTDHDPITNEFRGFLCPLCNRCLGGLGDTIEGVQQMLDYLINAKRKIEEKRKQ